MLDRRQRDGGVARDDASAPPRRGRRATGRDNGRDGRDAVAAPHSPRGRAAPGQGCASVSAQLGSAPGSMPNTERPSV